MEFYIKLKPSQDTIIIKNPTVAYSEKPFSHKWNSFSSSNLKIITVIKTSYAQYLL